jgi:II/X family phage/plasmid replication protein
MMIDWLTLRVPYTVAPGLEQHMAIFGDRIQRYCPATGEVRWESSAWDSIRSDSHGITVRGGVDAFWVQGSPARVMTGQNVVGSTDIQECGLAMIEAAAAAVKFDLPTYLPLWVCSRIDLTSNYLMDSLADVRMVLSYLRDVEGGRYRVSQQAGDSVYWNHKSHLRTGKAYAKGPHMRYLIKSQAYDGPQFQENELRNLDRVLRLELSLRSQFLRERLGKKWYELGSDDLVRLHSEFFDRMIGECEWVESDMSNIESMCKKIMSVEYAPGKYRTQSRALSAARTWQLIRTLGWETARASMNKRTYYDHVAMLRQAGLGDIEITKGNVVQLRRKGLVLGPEITSLEQLNRLCA